MGFEIPAKAALDTPADAFNFQITDMPEIMATPKVFLKHFFVKSRRKFIQICDLQIANSNSNIIENYEKVTPILIYS